MLSLNIIDDGEELKIALYEPVLGSDKLVSFRIKNTEETFEMAKKFSNALKAINNVA